jgi:hypothetical protein
MRIILIKLWSVIKSLWGILKPLWAILKQFPTNSIYHNKIANIEFININIYIFKNKAIKIYACA